MCGLISFINFIMFPNCQEECVFLGQLCSTISDFLEFMLTRSLLFMPCTIWRAAARSVGLSGMRATSSATVGAPTNTEPIFMPILLLVRASSRPLL